MTEDAEVDPVVRANILRGQVAPLTARVADAVAFDEHHAHHDSQDVVVVVLIVGTEHGLDHILDGLALVFQAMARASEDRVCQAIDERRLILFRVLLRSHDSAFQ